MEPPQATTIRRPFHWGIVVISGDASGELPEVDPDRLVSANENGVIILVRHAQDSDDYVGEDLQFAEAEVVVTLRGEPSPNSLSRREVFQGVINAPTGYLTVGDADADAIVPAHAGPNAVVVSVDAQVSHDDLSPDAVWVDLLPTLPV